MTKIKCHTLILTVVFLMNMSFGFSQSSGEKTVSITLPEVSLISINPNTNINFNFSTPVGNGSKLGIPVSNETKWLNYTSAKSSSSPSKSIHVKLDQVISGIDVKIVAGPAVGGAGTRGTSAGTKTLTTTAQPIVTGIGGAYTGNGTNQGHKLTISVEISNYSQLIQMTNKTLTLTYTISN